MGMMTFKFGNTRMPRVPFTRNWLVFRYQEIEFRLHPRVESRVTVYSKSSAPSTLLSCYSEPKHRIFQFSIPVFVPSLLSRQILTHPNDPSTR